MISPLRFIDILTRSGVDFFSGVPDSLLSSLSACIVDRLPGSDHVIAANEGAAVALCSGYHLSTGRIGCCYMQNSGLGNALNPLLSLCDEEVYGIPVLLVVGWRGEPGVRDEPQHRKQGRVTTALLEACGIPWEVLCDEEEPAFAQVGRAVSFMRENSRPYALVVRKGTFRAYEGGGRTTGSGDGLPLSREDAIRVVLDHLGQDAVVVSTTGMASRELFELREARGERHCGDFLTVGSMGHASQIALEISVRWPRRRVVCLDGDGAVLMHMGSLAICGRNAGDNFLHVVINNGAHESVGGQPTVALDVDLAGVAASAGYGTAVCVDNGGDLAAFLGSYVLRPGPYFLEVRVRKGHRPDLGRPTVSPSDNKEAFMEALRCGREDDGAVDN